MHPLEMQVERIQVDVSAKPGGHVCRLHAWAQRGQTVVIESSSKSRRGAIESAADSLRRTILGRTLRAPVAAVLRARCREEPARCSRLDRGSRGRRRLLLALRDLDVSSACIQWAQVLCGALEAELDVCRIPSNLPEASDAPSGDAWLAATRRLLTDTRETRRWCAEVLPDAKLAERLILSADELAEEAALRAREYGVDWIVMPDLREGSGRSAAAVARAAGCPVLVARAPTSRSTLLVASDLGGELYPIASRAAELAEGLHAPVLAFHDVGSRSQVSSRLPGLIEAWAQIQRARLSTGGHQRLPELEVLLAHGTDRVDTILQQARREDAEIIIVGVGAEADADDEVVAGVVERAIRSVLVVPSTAARTPACDGSAVEEGPDSRPPSSSASIERRRWPRAGARARQPSGRRRWRSG